MIKIDTKLMHPRDQITEIIGRIYRAGMTTTSGGNISIIDDDGDIWVTPSAIDKGSLTRKDIAELSGMSSETLWCADHFKSFLAIVNDMDSPLAKHNSCVIKINLHAGTETKIPAKTYVNNLIVMYL